MQAGTHPGKLIINIVALVAIVAFVTIVAVVAIVLATTSPFPEGTRKGMPLLYTNTPEKLLDMLELMLCFA